MVKYDSSRDAIVVFGGKSISVGRAERLISDLESAVETAREYRDTPDLHDVNLNNRALTHLLNPTDKDYTVLVEVAHEDGADLASEYFLDVLDQNESHGWVDAHINAANIHDFFEESTGVEGLLVESPQPGASPP